MTSDVVSKMELEPNGMGRMIGNCPFCNKRTLFVWVEPGYYFCQRCGNEGKVSDLEKQDENKN